LVTEEPVQGRTDPDNPWPGLAAYSEEASTYFYGRGEEIGELLRRVRRNLLTVLFGQSGLGKTSLLQAGLFPRLRSEHFLPVTLRLDFSPGAVDLVSQVKTRIKQVIAQSGLVDAPLPGTDEMLWAYFHRRELHLRGPEGEPLVLVLVFDQFEEIFTLGEGGRTSGSHLFLTELSDLVENRPPIEIEQRIEADLDAADQFEFGNDQYRILLSLREDYLPHLEDLRVSMPSLTQNRIRLNRMTDRQAVDAVLGPGGELVSASLAQEIVRFVSGVDTKERGEESTRIEVEPSLLSLVCHELNNKRRTQGQNTITADLLAGSSDAILHDFYERCLADQVPAVRSFVEDQLLTDSGFRESIALERARKLLEQQGAPSTAVDQLIDRRLLHVEERLNVRRVELTHDVLVGVVKSSRNTRRSREEKEEAERLRERAEEQRRQAEERELRTRRALRKARFTVAAFGILLIAALVAAGWAMIANEEAKRETKRAVEAETEAKRERNRAVQANELAQRTVLQTREKILDYNSTIVTLAGKLIENAAPEDAALLHEIRAGALSPLGKHQDAIDDETIALDINPNLIWARLSRGFEYINVGDSKRALADFEFALRINARGPLAFLHKGQLLGFQGQYEEAERTIKSGIEQFKFTFEEYEETELSPDLKTATHQTVLFVDAKEALHAFYLELANLKAYAGEPDFAAALKAADDLKATSNGGALFALLWAWQHIQNRPEDYGALGIQGALWERAGFKDWAKEYYTRFERTHAEKRAARYSELAKWVEKRLEELQDSPFPVEGPLKSSLLVLEAQELTGKGNLVKARELMDLAVAQEPENIGLLISRAQYFLDNKLYREAVRDCDAIVARSPRTAIAYFLRARAKLSLNEDETDIEADFRKSMECDPHLSLPLLWLSARLESRDPKEALKLLYQGVKEGIWLTDTPYVYWRIAILQNVLGKYQEAAEAARLAISLKSDALDYYEPLDSAERGLGKSARDATREVVTFCQTQAEARSALGQKWNAFNTYWSGLQFLAGKSPGSDVEEVRPEIASMVSGISRILQSIGSKEQGIVFWTTAVTSDWFKAYDQASKDEILKSIGLKQQATIFWKAVIKSNRFKAYNQVFQDEIVRISASSGSPAPVQ
jgi:tetratricopeptide (TPR) repeat protein